MKAYNLINFDFHYIYYNNVVYINDGVRCEKKDEVGDIRCEDDVYVKRICIPCINIMKQIYYIHTTEVNWVGKYKHKHRLYMSEKLFKTYFILHIIYKKKQL